MFFMIVSACAVFGGDFDCRSYVVNDQAGVLFFEQRGDCESQTFNASGALADLIARRGGELTWLSVICQSAVADKKV